MKKVFIFALGAAVGSLITWKIIEEKYKKIADDEIDSVVEQFKKREEELNAIVEDYMDRKEKNRRDPHIEETVKVYADGNEIGAYKQQINDLNYDTKDFEEDPLETEQDEDSDDYIKPYVISPDEFGETGNETKSLMYYADFVLADDDDDIIVDPESLIGDALEHFGEYEEDSVHVRNVNIECDFEILKSEKTFSEVYNGEDI